MWGPHVEHQNEANMAPKSAPARPVEPESGRICFVLVLRPKIDPRQPVSLSKRPRGTETLGGDILDLSTNNDNYDWLRFSTGLYGVSAMFPLRFCCRFTGSGQNEQQNQKPKGKKGG